VAQGGGLPDKDRLLRKAKRAVKLLEEGRLGRQELFDLLGEVAAGSEWANETKDNKPENLLHAQIPEYIGAVKDAASNAG
jgi:hypothetical protein